MHVCFFQTSLGFAWKSCVARFPLVFQHFGLWRCQLQVLTGDTAFSDDAQVPHLSQWFFLALGMELLHLCSRIWWIIMHHTIFAKTSHLWRTIYKPRILFQPRGLEHKLLGMFVFSLNHSLGEKACVWRRRSEMVLKVFHFFMGLKSSWINFATYDVPDIKVGYNMLISGRKLGNTYKPRKSFIDKSSNWFLTDCDMKTEHWQAKCLLYLINVSKLSQCTAPFD